MKRYFSHALDYLLRIDCMLKEIFFEKFIILILNNEGFVMRGIIPCFYKISVFRCTEFCLRFPYKQTFLRPGETGYILNDPEHLSVFQLLIFICQHNTMKFVKALDISKYFNGDSLIM